MILTAEELVKKIARWHGQPHPPDVAFMVAAKAVSEGVPVPIWASEALDDLPTPRLSGLRRSGGGVEGVISE